MNKINLEPITGSLFKKYKLGSIIENGGFGGPPTTVLNTLSGPKGKPPKKDTYDTLTEKNPGEFNAKDFKFEKSK